MEDEKLLLGVVELDEAKRLRSALLTTGVELEFVHNPETCSDKSCKPKVELYVAQNKAEKVLEFLRRERENLMAGIESMAKHVDEVFDTGKAEATCPACGNVFATTAKECPDCGLVFMGEAEHE